MKIRVSKRKWNFALVNAALVLLTLICAIAFFPIRCTLDSLDAADRMTVEITASSFIFQLWLFTADRYSLSDIGLARSDFARGSTTDKPYSQQMLSEVAMSSSTSR